MRFWTVYDQILESWPTFREGLPASCFETEYITQGRFRFETTASLVNEARQPKAILDIGTGPFSFLLRHLFQDSAISTLDVNDLFKQKCEANGISFKCVNLIEKPIPWPNGYFDVVIIAEVIEHLPCHPVPILRECWRLLKPGGFCIVTTPNVTRLQNRLKLLVGRPIQQMWLEDNYLTQLHYREYTQQELLSAMKTAAFKRVRISYDKSFDTPAYCRDVIQLQHQKAIIRGGKLGSAVVLAAFLVYSAVVWAIPPFRRQLVAIGEKIEE